MRPTRRTTLLTFLAGSVASAVATPRSAAAQGTSGFGSLTVDVGPLRAKGLGPYADHVAATMRSALAEAFVDRMVRGGPKLVVRLDGLSMRSYAGSETRFGSGGSPNDYLEGEALVVGPRGAVLRRQPQLSAVPASSGGAWYLPDNEDRRLAAICAHFAGWLRRELG